MNIMRHNLISSRWKLMVIISSVFLTLNTVVFGVPLSMSYSNQDNEHYAQDKERDDKKLADSSCLVNGSNYEEGDYVPGAGPCEECICHPPNVVCSMMKCPINSGCITIQLPNKCCPKYKCDCEHKGKQYNNGEKINKSDESACRVCFCNGGEIVCTSIVCYTRIDCKGYYLPGDCCPKYDNCSSIPIEQKSKESIDSEKPNIHYWSHSTAQSYSEENIWKRDTTESQKQELYTVPNIITMPSTYFDYEKEPRQRNMSLPYKFFEELYQSTSNSLLDKNITFNESDNTINTPYVFLTDDVLNTTENSKTFFLGFESDNLTIHEDITESSFTTNEPFEIIPQFEDLFDTATDIDNSLVIAHDNSTINILDITETPSTEDVFNSSTETIITQVEILNPNDETNTEKPMIELPTISPELEVTTEIDYEESREATTPRPPDKSTFGTPHKILMDSKQKNIEDEINTEITFTDLEDTIDMFGPNFGYRTYKTQTPKLSINSNIVNPQVKEISYETTFLPNTISNSTNSSDITSKSPYNELFINTNTISLQNNTSVYMDNDTEKISVTSNKPTEMYNNSNYLEMEKTNFTECVNNSCTNNSKQNDKLMDSQTESSSNTPFIIETKILPNQESSRIINKKMPYPKEYPEEFETIQNGPSFIVTKKTYTSIPDIVYTTTTMITLPTLDLIYKADQDIQKYLANMQSTTNKPNNNLSPLQNISSSNTT